MDIRRITDKLLEQVGPLASRLELLMRNPQAKRVIILMGVVIAFSTLVAFLINRVSF